MFGTRFYGIYYNMRERCISKKHPRFKHYGGKGIEVEWKSFMEFYNDMYEEYELHVKEHGEKQTTLDRLDNLNNYNKGNCKWSTYKEQNNNRCIKCKKYEYNGRKYTMTELAKIAGKKRDTVYRRIEEGDWLVKDAVEVPVRGKTLKEKGFKITKE